MRKDALTVEMDFRPDTIADQNAQGGWDKSQIPVGGPAPRQKWTHGSAESE